MKRTNTARWIESTHRWQINVQNDGVRKTFTSAKAGREGQREANRKADDWLEKGVSTTRCRVCDAWEMYLNSRREVSENEYRNQSAFYRLYVQPTLGNKSVKALTAQDYQNIINHAFRHPAGGGKELSRKTLKNHASYLAQFQKYCRRNGLATLDSEIELPKAARNVGKRVLSVEELRKVFTVDTIIYRHKLRRDDFINYYRFQLATGLRPGELRGLQWSDIKGDVCEIHGAYNNRNEITRGKNENALRSFTLSPLAKSILLSQSVYTAGQKYIFPMESMRTYYECWQRYQTQNGIKPISLYEMRHTFVSIAKGLPEGYLKQLVGHSQSMDSYGIYSHELAGDSQKTAQMVQAIFDKLL